MKILLLAVILMLAGCAEMNARKQYDAQAKSINSYVAEQKPKAESGEIKWSDYYRGIYDKFANSSFGDKGYMMTSLAEYIDISMQYEDGKITKQQFELLKLKEAAAIESQGDEFRQREDELRQARNAKALERRANLPPPGYVDPNLFRRTAPKTTNCYTYGNNTNCTTQ